MPSLYRYRVFRNTCRRVNPILVHEHKRGFLQVNWTATNGSLPRFALHKANASCIGEHLHVQHCSQMLTDEQLDLMLLIDRACSKHASTLGMLAMTVELFQASFHACMSDIEIYQHSYPNLKDAMLAYIAFSVSAACRASGMPVHKPGKMWLELTCMCACWPARSFCLDLQRFQRL